MTDDTSQLHSGAVPSHSDAPAGSPPGVSPVNAYREEVERFVRRPAGYEWGDEIVEVPFRACQIDESLYGLRQRLTAKYSWSIPTEELLVVATELGPIVSVGAGTGYIEHLIECAGGDVEATDSHVWPDTTYDHGAPWMRVTRLTHLEAIEKFPTRTLMLSWPPYAEPMAAEVLAAYAGAALLYIGESRGGCNATMPFFDLLEADFYQDREILLPRWHGINDIATIYKRKQPKADR